MEQRNAKCVFTFIIAPYMTRVNNDAFFTSRECRYARKARLARSSFRSFDFAFRNRVFEIASC